MQNNVTELTQRLLRSLDSNYNVIDMPAVIEIISLLEKVAITKELLQTTRLGKHVNELRRKTTNDSLSKRAKELVKKWRNMILPESNGQIKSSTSSDQEDVNLNQLKSKKRPTKDILDNINPKRVKVNGTSSELDFSDNSNSSFKDVINSNLLKAEPKRDVILINSDSNSSMPEAKQDPQLDQQMPKKRGRKKGSKNHKNLLDEAESSFTSKLAVSRGNSKVKTTQELIASLQNKNSNSVLTLPSSNAKSKEDLNERAAKLTERVSIIDQKLNTNANRFKNSQRKNRTGHAFGEPVITGSVYNDKSLINNDDEVIVVDDTEAPVRDFKEETQESQETESEANTFIKPDNELNQQVVQTGTMGSSLSIEDALAQLPPIDKSVLLLDLEQEEPRCSCFLKENKPDFSVEEDADDVDVEQRFEFVEDQKCPAKDYLRNKYNLDEVNDETVRQLHDTCIPNVNGNYSLGHADQSPELLDNGLYVNVVPNVNNECVKRNLITNSDFSGENFKKYSISECDSSSEVRTGGVEDDCEDVKPDVNNATTTTDNTDNTATSDKYSFHEWHELVETPSYNGEILKILPYVIID